MSSVTQDDDGIDEALWQTVSDVVRAAHRYDISELKRVHQRFFDGPPDDGRLATYIWCLLRVKTEQLAGHQPSAADLAKIAARTQDQFTRLIREPALYEDTLLSAWGLAAPEREVPVIIISVTVFDE